MYVKNTNQIPPDHQLKLSNVGKDSAGFYTWEKKIEVVTKYLALGNYRLVSELCKVDYRTIMFWKKEPWWTELVEEIKKTRHTEQNTKLSRIVDKALATVEDRLENGDFVLNQKTGEIIRKPVTIREANQVTKDLLAHQLKTEELVNKMENRQDSVQDQLKLLAAEFAKWSKKLTKETATTIEYKEVPDALHEERQEGLQEGSGEIHFQAGSDQEADSTERSSESDGKEGVSA